MMRKLLESLMGIRVIEHRYRFGEGDRKRR